MKHLSKREDFLKRNKYSNIQNIINEEAGGPFTNDIPWGDSLVGRLINSFLRKAKIGYNSTKIEPLVESFKGELDVLIANSLSRDTMNSFNILQLKSFFHEIREVCTNTSSKEERLDELIGGHQDLWDPQDQDGGDWRVILTGGIVPKCHDFIENKMTKEFLENAGIPRDKLLDEVSHFIDNLRRITSTQSTALANHRNVGFPQTFGNLVNRFTGIIVENFRLSGYDEFLLEEEKKFKRLSNGANQRVKDISRNQKSNTQKEEPVKTQAQVQSPTQSQTQAPVKKEVLDPKVQAKYDELLAQWKKSQGSGNTRPGMGTRAKLEREAKLAVESPQAQVATQSQTQAQAPANDDIVKNKIKKIKEIANKLKEVKFETSEDILKNADAVTFIKAVSSLNQEDLDYIKLKNPTDKTIDSDIKSFSSSEDIKTVVVKPEAEKEEQKPVTASASQVDTKEEQKPVAASASQTPTKTIAGSASQSTTKEVQKENNNYIYGNNYSYIFEAAGTQSMTPEACWNKFTTEGRIPAELVDITQREIDELEQLTISNTNGTLTYDISANPDPIIGICRIFKRAHDIYFTPVIPSGRSGGKVSNKTFLEYEKLGGAASGSSDADNPGTGPWAVKKLRNAWTDGVTKVLQDQKYRKILSNIKFIAPGAEDNFNKTSGEIRTESYIKRYDKFMRVFEATGDERDDTSAAGGTLGVDKKSHGQILFDFINAMLDNKTAANFDEERRVLLKKYFEPYGLKVNGIDGRPSAQPAPIVTIPDNAQAKSIFWLSYNGGMKAPGQTGFKGHIYAVPLDPSSPGNVSNPKHKMLFVHLLRTIPTVQTGLTNTVCYYVKFLFDHQEMVNKYKDINRRDYTIAKDWNMQSAAPQNVYYGIMTKQSGGKFTLIYANIANKNEPGEIYGTKNNFKVSTNNSMTALSGDTVTPAVLMESETGGSNSIEVDTDLCPEIKGEFTSHTQNLQIESKDPNYQGKLIDQLLKKLKDVYAATP